MQLLAKIAKISPLIFFKLLAFILTIYALFRSYKTYKQTKNRSALIMFILITIFTLNILANIFDIEEWLFIARVFKIKLILSLLPIIAFLMFDYVERKRHKAEAEGLHVKDLFRKYVNPYILDQLIKNPRRIIDGKKQEVSVLFIDIRGFTSWAERMDAIEVVKLLNKYFKAVSDAIFKYNGTIDKFIGDSVMAVFNAPLQQENHSDMAVKTGIEIFKNLDELNKTLKTPLKAGIGINTGEAVVGNVGTERRVDYTVIGDAVNIASRLQNEAGDREILISDSVKSNLKDKSIKYKLHGRFKLKGKEIPVTVYKIIY